MAAEAQTGNHFGLPNTSIATVKSLMRKADTNGLSVLLAAQAGSNLIANSCGTQARFLGCSFESCIIDSDMLGAILSAARPIEVSEGTLSKESIERIACGECRSTGREETFVRMNSGFNYSKLADRR
ncbi:MAG: trimethylamine methyltransferase family protein [Albidovulum sp.]|nr:trimethylamine methyltransferase family protein [Albidovulum sp.]